MPRGRSKKPLLSNTNNNAQTQTIENNQPAQEPLKELEPKVTVIARNNYKFVLPDGKTVQELFDITYGGLLLPIIESKGPVAIKRSKYLEFLNAFLDSEEGKKYRRPSPQEIDDAMNLVRAEIEAYSNARKGIKQLSDQNNQPQQTQTVNPVNTPTPQPVQQPQPQPQPQPQTVTPDPLIQQAKAEQQRQLNVMQEELARQQTVFNQNQAAIQEQLNQFNALKEQAELQRQNVEALRLQMESEKAELTRIQTEKEQAAAEPAGENNEAPVRNVEIPDIKPLKIFGMASMILSLLTLGLVGFMMFRSMTSASAEDPATEAPQVFEGEGTLNINGTEYSVPLSTIKIENGQTKTVFYAIETSLDENGEPSADAYPIGTWVFDSSNVNMTQETAEPAAETPPANN